VDAVVDYPFVVVAVTEARESNTEKENRSREEKATPRGKSDAGKEKVMPGRHWQTLPAS
jgi:hypothetical protein